jgi:phosphoribosylformylglycinamidine (FGAM) synthase-like enzyme
MLGIMKDKANATSLAFKKAGDAIFLLGESQDDVASSEYIYSFHKIKNTPAPYFDLEKEHALQQTLKQLIKDKLVQSAHDCSDGGLFITLAESAMPNKLGFIITTDNRYRKDCFLFGEAQSRVVVSISASNKEKFIQSLKKSNTPYYELGAVSAKEISIDGQKWFDTLEIADTYNNSLEKMLA